MNDFKHEIQADIDWRYSELATVKKMPTQENLLLHQRDFLVKYAVPIIYSLWEGYIRSTFETYIRIINSLNLKTNEVNINLLIFALNSNDLLNIGKARTNKKTQTEFVENLIDYFSSNFIINLEVPTKSNVKFDVVNQILLGFNLKPLPEKFKHKLDKKLLFYRNAIAHGENSIPITLNDIEMLSTLVHDLMFEIATILFEGYDNKSYLK